MGWRRCRVWRGHPRVGAAFGGDPGHHRWSARCLAPASRPPPVTDPGPPRPAVPPWWRAPVLRLRLQLLAPASASRYRFALRLHKSRSRCATAPPVWRPAWRCDRDRPQVSPGRRAPRATGAFMRGEMSCLVSLDGVVVVRSSCSEHVHAGRCGGPHLPATSSASCRCDRCGAASGPGDGAEPGHRRRAVRAGRSGREVPVLRLGAGSYLVVGRVAGLLPRLPHGQVGADGKPSR